MTEVINPVAVQPAQSSSTDSDKSESSSWGSYIFTGIAVVVLLYTCWYAYGKFVENSCAEPFVKGLTQERDDPVVDFNLRDAIKQLEGTQRNILQRISGDVGI